MVSFESDYNNGCLPEILKKKEEPENTEETTEETGITTKADTIC